MLRSDNRIQPYLRPLRRPGRLLRQLARGRPPGLGWLRPGVRLALGWRGVQRDALRRLLVADDGDLGFSRIVVSEIEAPNMLAIPV